jgi:hypothetical protein
MFVDLKENKWQISITSCIAMIYYYYTRNELNSIIIVLVLAIFLRKINIDSYIELNIKK